MKLEIKKTIHVNIHTLHVEAGVRYWEDSTVNGQEDTEGVLIPCRNNDLWVPVINVGTGQILNWEKGKSANIHYKVCDSGRYWFEDTEGERYLMKDGYVPKIMCPKESGYGDYIIMDVNEEGFIDNWKFTISGFEQED